MSLKSDILLQLQAIGGGGGGRISGEELGKRYGVTRAAVWKAIASLKKDGYSITGTPKAGYSLAPSDVLSEEQILLDLSLLGIRGVKVFVYDNVASTNATAAEISGRILSEETPAAKESPATPATPEPKNSPVLIVARTQTDGRARKGNRFLSETGGLYMSLILFPQISTDKLRRLHEEIYASVNRVLKGERKENAVYVNGEKVCGILTESTADPDTIKSCIAGIGIYPWLLPEPIRTEYPDRSKLCAAVCKEIFSSLNNL